MTLWHTYSYRVINKVAVCCIFLIYICSNVGLHVDYTIIAVGIHVQGGRHIFQGLCQ